MKKVVHLTSVHSPFDTRIFLKQCCTLASEGYEVVLIAPHSREEIVDGVQIRPVPLPRGRFSRVFLTTYRVARSALRENGDLYHIHDPELLPVGQWLRLQGKQVVYDMHENLPKEVLSKMWIPRLLRPLTSVLCCTGVKYFLKGLPVLFAETSYRNDYPWVEQYRIVLNMPRIEKLPQTQLQHETPTAGYIGGVSSERGSDVTIEALALLKESGCNVHFECVGPISDQHEQELRVQANETGLKEIHFYGRMPAVKGWPIIARCHFGLAVLQASPNFVDSYPTKIFEYMGMGLPVITSDVPLYREVIESADCGICVDPKDPQEIANAMYWLVSHPKEAAAMGKRGQQAVQKRFSWKAESLKLFSLYKELLYENCHDRRSTPSVHQRGDREPCLGKTA